MKDKREKFYLNFVNELNFFRKTFGGVKNPF